MENNEGFEPESNRRVTSRFGSVRGRSRSTCGGARRLQVLDLEAACHFVEVHLELGTDGEAQLLSVAAHDVNLHIRISTLLHRLLAARTAGARVNDALGLITVDALPLGEAGHRHRVCGLRGASGSASRAWASELMARETALRTRTSRCRTGPRCAGARKQRRSSRCRGATSTARAAGAASSRTCPRCRTRRSLRRPRA
ncbi:hypothetical protein T492DRAFT_997900 [Pavlovales sp. CCMP2436]|nr:hypothetical protein T492DRAFT_997900 [Pavlovales sp. CCMP2436]